MMVLGRTKHNLKLIKKLVFVLILFALSLIFIPKVGAYTVTYPDNKVDTVEEGKKYILSMKDHKETEIISTVTFKSHQDGVDDYVSYVKKKYFLEKWIIDGVEYEPGSPIEVNSDITVTGSYHEYIEPVTIPSAPLVYGYTFIGWYDQEEGGTRYKTYSGTQDLTLHAQYIVENKAPFNVEVNNSKWTKFKSTATAFRKATVEEYNAKQAELTSSDNYGNEYHPIYIWLEGTELVYYTESSSITITRPNKMFNNWSKIEYIDLSGWYIRYLYSSNAEISATDISYMFNNCSSLTYLDISDFDTSKVTNMNYMFSGTKLASLDLSHFNTSEVTQMAGMFSNMGSLENLNISSFNTSKVTSMQYMFSNSNINYLDLSNFNTSNVTGMSSMFNNSKNTNYLNISSFDTSKVTYMTSMFAGSSFKHLDLSNLDVSQASSFENVFYNAQSLEYVDLSNWDTRRSRSFYGMFKNCYNLKYLDLSSFKIYKATNLSQMFQGCRNLEELDLSSFDLNNVEYINYMFAEMSKIKTIDISNFSTPNLKNMQCLFCDDTSLETIYANELFNTDQCPTGVMSDGTMVYVFVRNDNLVGQAGTRFSEAFHTGKDYAVIDDPDNGKPGYFTYKAYNPKIYYPDMSYEEVEPYYVLTLPESYSKADDNLAKVTLKYEDGNTEDKEVYVKKNYTFNNWLVYDEVAEPGDTFVITFDTYLEADYVESIVGADLQTPRRLGYKFLGWYTDPENGELVESYNGEENITLYAHWTEAVTSTLVRGYEFDSFVRDKDFNTFRKATLEEYNNVSSTLTDDNIISTDDSDVPTYYWNQDGDFVYYSEADIIYLNESCWQMFLYSRFRTIDLSGLDSTKVTDTREMFAYNDYLTSINFTNFDTSNVTQATHMFDQLKAIRELDLSNFNTSKVESAQGMFSGLDSIEELDVSSFDMSSATDLYCMFSSMPNLTTIYVSDKWDVSHYGENPYNDQVFYYVLNLTGYYGTVYSGDHAKWDYAHIDGGVENPGYLTHVSHKGETHTVTYPDGTVEIKKHNGIITLGNNNTETDRVEDLATITFKLHNGEDDIIKHVQNVYYADGFLVNGISYSDGDNVRVNEDKAIDYNYTGYPESPEFPENPTDDRRLFLGWYTEEEDGDEVDYYDGEDDITLHAHWSEELLKLTVDGKTTLVEPGYIYTVPNATPDPYAPVNNKIHLHLYYMDEEDTQKDVVISEGYSIGYQIINGDTYYPGDTYVVNDETEVVSIYDWNGQYAMDPYIKEPTRDGYIFMGWQLYNWEYDDVSDINVDIYTIEPYYTWFDGASFYAEWQEEPDPDEYVVVRYKDYIKKKDYKKIYPKGYVYTFGDLAEVNSFDVEIRNNVNDDTATVTYTTHITSNSYTVKIVGSDDESWRNSNNWYHPGDTYEINEDIEINVLTAAYTDNSHYNGGCSGNAYLCELALATAENSRYNNYIFRGVYTEENGQGVKLNPHTIVNNNTYYGSHNGFNTLWVYLEEVDENSVIVTVDGEVFIVPKGEGTIPSPSITSETANYIITYKFNNGDPDVLGIDTVRYYIGSLDYNGDEYQLGDTFDFEEDTTFWSNWELEPIGDGLLEVNDEHFLGWFDENDNQVTSLDDIDDNITLYAQWTTEPTVEICHGKGDCEEIVKGTTVTLERPEPTVITAHFTLDYNTEEPGYEPKQVTTTRTDTVEYYMINNERYDFGETYTFNENVDMYGVTTYTYTSDFVGYYNDNWDYGLNINGYELRGWCATTDGRYCRYYDEDEDIVQPDGLTLYATYYSSEGDTVRVTVDWDTQYDWPKGESILIPDDIVENIAFAEPQSYSREIDFDLNDGSGETLSGSIAVNEVFSHFRVGNDDVKKYQQHDLYTFYRDIHIQSQFVDEYGEIDFPEMNEPTFKGWYTKPEGGRRIKNTEDFVKYMDLYNSFTLYAHYGEISEELESVLYVVANRTNEDQSVTRFIVGADAGTLISEFKENMDNPNEYIKIYDLDNNEVSDDDIIKTGLIIKLVIDGNIYDEATMVVRGDMDGDGIVNITDLLQVKNHIQELTLIEDPIRFIAANVVTDDILNVSDQLKLSNYLNENIDTLNE